ncbi:hypothetical protein SEA_REDWATTLEHOG_142 [Gordonia phage RedWattleHog]|uniref:Uncharacterized protein n=1 Tax=Gordonia phage Stormageddon TaxID=2656541 RepID=A0A649VR56_9CAUD|nr:hypothetical protein KHQ86_gp160 [Gordonia phage Stormageddon]QGJ95000.1 hypothetical protein SEA_STORMAGEDDON_140 [Gordonia phage Stormageddon]QLF83645.1 hypothetical protein SEA_REDWATTLEHOG_142 [Gordonia phage RedWattleHog]
MIQVKPIENEMWQVTSNGRWWTVARIRTFTMVGWHIMNETGRTISADGQLGRKLIAAVQAKLEEV